MKRLILMRHAESDWSGSSGTDHSRVLNARGRRGAERLGRWLKEHEYLPDRVLCSDASRTRETLLLLELQTNSVEHLRALYLAGPPEMLDLLREADGEAVLMVAHNPGCATCAQWFPVASEVREYPPGATSVIDFDVEDWGKIDWGTGRLRDYVSPRDLD